jgi:hypothetical protein
MIEETTNDRELYMRCIYHAVAAVNNYVQARPNFLNMPEVNDAIVKLADRLYKEAHDKKPITT